MGATGFIPVFRSCLAGPRREPGDTRPWGGRCCLLCACLLSLPACASQPDAVLPELVSRGEFGQLRQRVERGSTNDRSDRDYMLDRMRVTLAALADGLPHEADRAVSEAYEVLRTQGINDDKTVAAAVLGEEGVIWWKGEPFEQAMMYHAIAVQQALLDQWDNVRAAASSSLFLLKDFGDNERGGRKSSQEVAESALERERAGEGTYEAYLDNGYTPAKTDFALGFLMNGVANWALGRSEPARQQEAEAQFREAVRLNPGLAPVVESLISGDANTIFMVDFGIGPEKVRTGPDGAIAVFAPRTASDDRPLELSVGGEAPVFFAAACDVNRMAADHSWNSLEDLRRAKSAIGSAMMIGGAVVAGSTGDQNSQLVGLGIFLAGLLTKATSGADIRACEILPQRVYVAPTRLVGAGASVRLSVGSATVVLPCLPPPLPTGQMRLFYVRMPAPRFAPEWAGEPRVLYANDSCPERVPGDELPYILGGRCVRAPSDAALRRYQQAGWLTDMTAADLSDLYRKEGIDPSSVPGSAQTGLHILEGGGSLRAPVAGSAGFVRLFCREHGAYSPRSPEVAALAARIRAQSAGRTPAAPETPGPAASSTIQPRH